MKLKNKTAAELAEHILKNKPHLIEIEEAIQTVGMFGELEIKVTIRQGKVVKAQFWGGKTWLKDKDSNHQTVDLTQSDLSDKNSGNEVRQEISRGESH